MSEFQPKDYWKVYLNKEAKERIREIQDHLEDNYDGKSDFVQKKLVEEKPVSLEQRIEKARENKEKEEERLERLLQIKEEREQQQTLQDKKDLLREKQEKLRKVEREGVSSLHELVMDEIAKRESRGHEIDESLARHCLDRAESKLDERPNVQELKSDIDRLQDEVKELNEGRESWFLDLQKVEV